MIRPITSSPAALPQPEPRTAEPTTSSGPEKLSSDEKQMIETFFPSSKRMDLRLYGPSRPLAPSAGGLGSRIDLKG